MALDSGSTATTSSSSQVVARLEQDGQLVACDPAGVAAMSLTSGSETTKSTSTVDAEAADDLFAALAASRAELKRRYFHR
jgi:hypothetical protein